MKKSTIPYTVMQLKKMYEKSGILDFDCPIQRRYGMWDDYKKRSVTTFNAYTGLSFHHCILQKKTKAQEIKRTDQYLIILALTVSTDFAAYSVLSMMSMHCIQKRRKLKLMEKLMKSLD
mgnify:CR=1 FL=1